METEQCQFLVYINIIIKTGLIINNKKPLRLLNLSGKQYEYKQTKLIYLGLTSL
jgi:hypothetical protein